MLRLAVEAQVPLCTENAKIRDYLKVDIPLPGAIYTFENESKSWADVPSLAL